MTMNRGALGAIGLLVIGVIAALAAAPARAAIFTAVYRVDTSVGQFSSGNTVSADHDSRSYHGLPTAIRKTPIAVVTADDVANFRDTPNPSALQNAGFTPMSQQDGRLAGNDGDATVYGSPFATHPIVRDAVPEPAAWALLFAGFGMVGAVLRRRSGLRMVAA